MKHRPYFINLRHNCEQANFNSASGLGIGSCNALYTLDQASFGYRASTNNCFERETNGVVESGVSNC